MEIQHNRNVLNVPLPMSADSYGERAVVPCSSGNSSAKKSGRDLIGRSAKEKRSSNRGQRRHLLARSQSEALGARVGFSKLPGEDR
jgi:hypothetical protein